MQKFSLMFVVLGLLIGPAAFAQETKEATPSETDQVEPSPGEDSEDLLKEATKALFNKFPTNTSTCSNGKVKVEGDVVTVGTSPGYYGNFNLRDLVQAKKVGDCTEYLDAKLEKKFGSINYFGNVTKKCPNKADAVTHVFFKLNRLANKELAMSYGYKEGGEIKSMCNYKTGVIPKPKGK